MNKRINMINIDRRALRLRRSSESELRELERIAQRKRTVDSIIRTFWTANNRNIREVQSAKNISTTNQL